MEQQNQNQSAGTEYSRCAVPLNQRRTRFSLTIVWMGFVFITTSMMAGDGLAARMDFKHIVLATLGDNTFLSIIAVLISIIAHRTGLTSALLTRYSFGSSGSKAASIFVPVINLGQYIIQAATYRHSVVQAFHMGQANEGLCMAANAIIMGIFAMSGIDAITALGYTATPVIVFLSIATAVCSLGAIGGVDALFSYSPAASMPLFTSITAVVGIWVLSTVTCITDIMHYAKDTKTAISAIPTGLLGGNILMIVCGAIVAITMEDSDLTVIPLGFGLVIPSLILVTTSTFTANAVNLYSTSLSLSNAFEMEHEKMLAILLALSALATLIKPHETGFPLTFLSILGTVVPPLSGVILSNCFLVHKGSHAAYGKTRFYKWNPIPWIAWATSVALIYMIPLGLPSLNGIILSVAVYTILMAVNKQQAAGNATEEA